MDLSFVPHVHSLWNVMMCWIQCMASYVFYSPVCSCVRLVNLTSDSRALVVTVLFQAPFIVMQCFQVLESAEFTAGRVGSCSSCSV